MAPTRTHIPGFGCPNGRWLIKVRALGLHLACPPPVWGVTPRAHPKATLITITITFIQFIIFKDDANTLALFVLRNFHGIREVIDPKIIHNLKIGPERCPRKKNLNNIAMKWRQIIGLPGHHMSWPGHYVSLLSNSALKTFFANPERNWV